MKMFQQQVVYGCILFLRAFRMCGGTTALFTYLMYTVLPLRLHEAAAGGSVLALVHMTLLCMLPTPSPIQVPLTLGVYLRFHNLCPGSLDLERAATDPGRRC